MTFFGRHSFWLSRVRFSTRSLLVLERKFEGKQALLPVSVLSGIHSGLFCDSSSVYGVFGTKCIGQGALVVKKRNQRGHPQGLFI